MEIPRIGVGVIIKNDKSEILIGKRHGSHAQYYSIPGGHLELGESFEEAAIREIFEETGLQIKNPQVFCVSNNLRTYKNEQKHYVSVNLFVNEFEGKLENKEPDKCEEWLWCKISEIPNPQFDASEFAIECFMKNQFYIKNQI